jgi:hypothetical protein
MNADNTDQEIARNGKIAKDRRNLKAGPHHGAAFSEACAAPTGLYIFPSAFPALAPSARPSAPRAVLGYLMSRLRRFIFASECIIVD